MQITKLKIKNFLSITDVEIKPGKVTQIVGANNQGKTSILKALEVAGRGSTDGSLVKRGEEQAEIIVELDNELTVRRRLSSSGKQDVQVRNELSKFDSPQSLLNAIFDTAAFNPLSLLDSKGRSETLLKTIPITVTEDDLKAAVGAECPVPLPPVDYGQHGLKVVDQAYKYFFQRRAEANKDLKTKQDKFTATKSTLPPMPQIIEGEEEAIQEAITNLKSEIANHGKELSLGISKQKELELTKQRLAELHTTMDGYRREIERIQAQLDAAKNSEKLYLDTIAQQEKELASHTVESRAEALNELLQQKMEQQNDLLKRKGVAAQYEGLKGLFEEGKKARALSEALDKVVNFLASDFKAQLMQKAELPVAGLEYRDGEFYLDGSCIDNLSSSRMLKLAIAIARKLSGKAKIICIDGAELLDSATYEEFRKEIEDDGFSYFLTRVGEPFAGNDAVVEMKLGEATKLQ